MTKLLIPALPLELEIRHLSCFNLFNTIMEVLGIKIQVKSVRTRMYQ